MGSTLLKASVMGRAKDVRFARPRACEWLRGEIGKSRKCEGVCGEGRVGKSVVERGMFWKGQMGPLNNLCGKCVGKSEERLRL